MARACARGVIRALKANALESDYWFRCRLVFVLGQLELNGSKSPRDDGGEAWDAGIEHEEVTRCCGTRWSLSRLASDAASVRWPVFFTLPSAVSASQLVDAIEHLTFCSIWLWHHGDGVVASGPR